MSISRFKSKELLRVLAAIVLIFCFTGLSNGGLAFAENVNILAKATFKFDRHTQGGRLSYSGSLRPAAKGVQIPPGTQVSVYDAVTGLLVHSTTIDLNNAFSYTLPMDTPICILKITAGSTVRFLKVAGARKICRTAPNCALTVSKVEYVNVSSAEQGNTFMFTGSTFFPSKKTPNMKFDLGNGDVYYSYILKVKGGFQAVTTYSFSKPENYRVSFTAKLGKKECRNSTIVSIGE
jgi:hypothetical protein